MDNSDIKTRLAAATAALEETRQLVEDTYRGVNGSVSLLGKALGYDEEQPSDDRGNNMSAAAEQGHYEHELNVAVRGWMEHGYHTDRAAFIASVYETAVKAWDKAHYEYSFEQEVLLEDLEKQDTH